MAVIQREPPVSNRLGCGRCENKYIGILSVSADKKIEFSVHIGIGRCENKFIGILSVLADKKIDFSVHIGIGRCEKKVIGHTLDLI